MKDNTDSTVFYTIDHTHTLLRRGVIERVSGLSRECKAARTLPHHYFKAQHYSSLDTLTFRGAAPRVIGSFPSVSYELRENKDKHYTLTIKDPQLFWSTCSYLIISTY